MKHILFADRNLDAFVAAILTFYKCLYDGETDIKFSPYCRADKLDEFNYGDTVIFLGVGLTTGSIEHLVYDRGISVVSVENNKKFVEDIGYSFVDWHNLNYFFLMETSEYDIFDKLDLKRPPSKVGWRYYFSDNDFDGKLVSAKRSHAGMVRDILLDKEPKVFNFFKTFVSKEVDRLIDLCQEHALTIHNKNDKSDSFLLDYWFKNWYLENEKEFEELKETGDLDLFLKLKSAFTMTSVDYKIEKGREKLHETKYKTKQIANSSCLKKIQFRHYDVTEMKACYVDDKEIAGMGGYIVGTELVKEHGWDVVVLNGPEQKDTRIYFLFSNPDGADIDVSEICKLYSDEGTALNKTGRRNFAGIEFLKGDEEMFFKLV